MKRYLIFSVFLFVFIGELFSQDAYPAYAYEYDDAGNRTRRTYIVWIPPDPEERSENNGNLTLLENVDKYNEVNNIKDRNEDEGKEILPIKFKKHINERDIILYPNPTSGNLKVEIADISNINESQILISDLTGKVLYSQEITSKQMDFDLGSQPSGAYILAIRINGVSKEWKIIKME